MAWKTYFNLSYFFIFPQRGSHKNKPQQNKLDISAKPTAKKPQAAEETNGKEEEEEAEEEEEVKKKKASRFVNDLRDSAICCAIFQL